ncbi:MAG: MFS transporter [Acidobacteria bacterium]|nr:MFS transporter [Acidobacteriota bacterium]
MQISSNRRKLITIGVLTSTLLAAMESTIVSTAMPTIVASLGGLSRYSWVFSIYLLTSTISMPIWGKLSDLYGRRSCYLVGIAIFLLGSVLSGASQSMNQLIVFRAIQGLGSGAIVPLSLIVIGEIYTLEERAKMQGVFSSVWGVSSIIGPILGGFIADHFSWRWVFYINIPVGLVATAIIIFGMKDLVSHSLTKPKIDYAGTVSLSLSISILLVACLESKEIASTKVILLLLLTFLFFAIAFIYFESKAEEPILPLNLFRNKVFLVSTLGNFFGGCILFGVISFVPLFMQVGLNTTATSSGKTIMFLLFSWICSSTVSGRLILHYGYRPLVIAGMLALVIGTSLLSLTVSSTSSIYNIYFSVAVIGVGMGLASFSILIAVQSSFPTDLLGVVTSSTQFFRNIGGVIGTGIFGSVMGISLTKSVNQISEKSLSQELEKIVNNPNLIVDVATRNNLAPSVITQFSNALSSALHLVFIISFFMSLIALLVAFLMPSKEEIRQFKEISLIPGEKTNPSH